MINQKITGRVMLVVCIVVSLAWYTLVRYQSNCAPNLLMEQDITKNAFPRAAASDLAFDRYLDQVIAGQAPSGTLPNLAPPTLRGTFLAVSTLQSLGFGADVDSAGVQAFITSCYDGGPSLFVDAATNSFEAGVRVSGYSALEGTYYALATLDALALLTPSAWQLTADAILNLQDGSGGFACRAGICTTHDAFFAYKALQILGDAGMVDVNALAAFVDARQMSDPARWWEYGAFTNLPVPAGFDADFGDPNLVSAYYAVATLAACGRSSMLNEAGLVQYTGLLKNVSSSLFSYASGNERAEHVGTACLLALDQYLTEDGDITYAAAGSALLARLEAGFLNEGRKAPANLTLSAACEMVWGLAEGGRLPELSSAARGNLRHYIASYLVASGSMTGYALTRLASLDELASLLPAITGAGKLDLMNVNALYAYIKASYSPITAYFTADGTALLQRDLPDCYNPASPDGAFCAGIAATLPALQVLQAIGRLNDFLGETHASNYILGNISASQFVNASAPAVSGAFCPQPGFASECEGKEYPRAWITPQWTLQSLEVIAILDPVTPTSHFDAGAVWSYLSQSYVEGETNDYFARPAWIAVSDVEWTCRVATALCKGGMAGYFDLAKVNEWVASYMDGVSAREVSWHLRFLASTTGLARAPYAVGTLSTLKDTLLSPNEKWYRAQGQAWPDTGIVGILARFRADRQTYLLNPTTPNPMILGGDNTVSADVSNLFSLNLPSSATVTFTAFNRSITLTQGVAGHYSGSFQCPFNYSQLGLGAINFTATRGGWQPASSLGSVTFAGTLIASVTCGEAPVQNDTTLAVKGSVITVETTLKVKLGATECPAQSLGVNLTISAGGVPVTHVNLVEASPGVYSGSYATGTAGTYTVEVAVQGKVLARFVVSLDGTTGGSTGDLGNLKGLPASLIVSSAAGGFAFVGVGMVSRKRNLRKNKARKSS